MILTDDPNGDVESTLRLLIRSSEMPISIIFIGIGNSDFSNFNRYLAKTDSDGRKEHIAFDNHRGVRDNVLFFKFNDLLKNGDLAGEILRSIPEQFLEFMKQNRISPNC